MMNVSDVSHITNHMTMLDLHGNQTGNVTIVTPDPSAVYMRYIVNRIDVYLIPLVVVLGILGNTLSLCVFLMTHLRKMSWSIYLAALAVSDSGFLLCVFVSWSNNIGFHLYHKQFFCQLFVYLTYVWSFLSVWYVVAFTLERFLVIQYPLRRNELTTPKRARFVVISVAVFAMVIYNFAIWTSGIQPLYDYESFCTVLPKYYGLVTVLSNVDTFITFVIPFLLIMFFNLAIIYKLARYHAQQRKETFGRKHVTRSSYLASQRFPRGGKMGQVPGQVMVTIRMNNLSATRSRSSSVTSYRSNHNTNQLNKLTYMLLVVSGVFLLLNFPIHAIRFYVFIQQFANPTFVPSHRFVSLQKFFQYVYYFNFAVNFFLYSLCGRTFRQALRLLVHRGLHRIRNLEMPTVKLACNCAEKNNSESNTPDHVTTEKTNTSKERWKTKQNSDCSS